MKKLNGLFIAFAISSTIYAQQNTDTVKVLNAVVVTGIKKEVLRHTPFNVTVLPASHLQNSINYSISDALAKLPGISQISTGVGISKPVIRGLYGNRIQTVLLGLRFDNQQWQDEHGLGLSIIGIDRIEVLKGPSSLLYGTEAMGGVIRIIEEAPADSNTKVSDINTQLYSNTYGLSVNGGIKATKNNRSWRIRLGMDSHADYADGNNNRVLNSRFSSYNAKASYGYIRKNWMNQNHIYTSFSKFGFIMEDNRDRKPVDARISRKMDGPNHSVFFTLLSSENSIALNNSRLELNGGVHTNLRLENEGGNRISLNMLLNTFSYNVRWFKPLTASWEFIAGNETQYQTNTNYGSRVIIPDAHLTESAVSVYIKKKGIVDVESGISLSERNITTFYTQNLNYTNNNIQPFSRWYASFNGNAGMAVNAGQHWNMKFNISTGYRSPNLAELSSNGVHEGTYRYEIGNPSMKVEQNLNMEININYESKGADVYSAVFLNQFRRYIYLTPTGQQLYGFDIYRFLQNDALFQGGELSVSVRPAAAISFTSQFSTVTGKLKNGDYLPFIPANRWTNELVLKKVTAFRNINVSWRTAVIAVSAQKHPGLFETGTDGYVLINTGFLFVLHRSAKDISLSLMAGNLLNKTYYDHLSRFKYFGIYNQGRNIHLSLSVPLSKKFI